MNSKIICFVALALILSTNASEIWGERKVSVEGVNPPPTYVINLDLPPSQRWTQVVTDNKEAILDAIDYIKNMIPNVIFQITPESLVKNYDPVMAQELIGMAQVLGVPVSYTFWINLMYELSTHCTSIVVQDINNNIFHGRNLDWSMASVIQPLMYVGDFQRNGTTLFRASIIAGMVTFLSAEKTGVFSVSADQRANTIINEDSSEHPDVEDAELAINLYDIVVEHRMSMLWSMRRALENATSYQEAYTMLATTKIAAPVYYIISGTQPGEGAVLEMNRDNVHASYSLNASNGTWYLVQTNYDRDLPDPSFDDRRTVAQDRMNAIGRSNINESVLFTEVLALYPNNNNGTVQTVIYSASQDFFNVTVWWEHQYDNSSSFDATFDFGSEFSIEI